MLIEILYLNTGAIIIFFVKLLLIFLAVGVEQYDIDVTEKLHFHNKTNSTSFILFANSSLSVHISHITPEDTHTQYTSSVKYICSHNKC